MATIVSRTHGNSATAHMARIIIERKGKVIFSENRTFERKQAAYAGVAATICTQIGQAVLLPNS
jgi:hypothetical protein